MFFTDLRDTEVGRQRTVVRLVETPEKTTMTITCKFAPTPDGELPGAGTEKSMRFAVGQIDAILTTTTWP